MFYEDSHYSPFSFHTLKLPSKLILVFAVAKKVIFVFECGAHLEFALGLTGHFLFDEGGHTRLRMKFSQRSISSESKKNPICSRSVGSVNSVNNNIDVSVSRSCNNTNIGDTKENMDTREDIKDIRDVKEISKEDTRDTKFIEDLKGTRFIEDLKGTRFIEDLKDTRFIEDVKDINNTANEIYLYLDDTRKRSGTLLFSSKQSYEKYKSKKFGVDFLANFDVDSYNRMESKNMETKTTETKDQVISFDDWKKIFKTRKRIIATLLTDQKLICGIGNYLRSEILYKSQIHPRTKSDKLTDEELKNLLQYTIEIMRSSLSKRGHTIMNYTDPLGRKGGFEAVIYGQSTKTRDQYRRDVRTLKLSKKGQNIYWSPEVQKLKT